MGDEMVVANKSSEIVDSEFYKSYSIMVVDDDITCLSIVAALLKKWKYQESCIVVPVMSADDRDSMVLEGLERGAVFFLLKPISPDDLRDIWQYAALGKKNKGKGKSVVIEEIQENNSSSKSSSGLLKSPHENVKSSSSINVEKGNKEGNKEESKKKSARKHKEAEKEESSTPPKKTKLVWTDALHNKFLQAIREIGLDRAYPRTILEVMDVPGLTRENVASHLQKYRIFLRKVTEESFRVQAADTNLANSATQSTFGSKGLTTISQLPQENSGSQQPFLKNNSLAETSNRSSSSLSNRRATPAVTLPGYGKAKLVLNEGDSSKITSSNANQLSIAEATKNQTRSLIHEDISTQLLNAAISANQLITRNLKSLHNSSAAGERHESNQSLVQRDSSLIGFERDKELAAMLTSYLNQGANRTQLTRLPNNVETREGSTGTRLDQGWSSYFNQGANHMQLTRLPNNVETGEGSGTIPDQDYEGEKQSAAMWSSYISQGANRMQLTRLPNNVETGGGSGTILGQDCEGEKQSAAMWSSYFNQGANRVQLTRFPNNFEAGGGSGTKPGQDGEGEKQSAAMWSSYPNQEANRVNQGEKQSEVVMRSSNLQLTRFPNNVETGGGSGTKLGQDFDVSMFDKNNATSYSSRIGDLTSTFYSQLNVQPFHVENSNDQGETTFNFTDASNQDQEAYYPLPLDYTSGEQGDHRGVTAEEGSSSQLCHTHQNPELEHGDDKDFWDSLLSLSPYNGDQ
ncbi:two-component response regulator ARR11-like [Nicotiana sylvestris]|uniref:two-component response regulator ARR11-like n=1 Tax=Nicotiana sylvestris TaxID=4096 RepID=UPI00388CCAC5